MSVKRYRSCVRSPVRNDTANGTMQAAPWTPGKIAFHAKLTGNVSATCRQIIKSIQQHFADSAKVARRCRPYNRQQGTPACFFPISMDGFEVISFHRNLSNQPLAAGADDRPQVFTPPSEPCKLRSDTRT